jgi:hypothetical protein
MEAGRENFTLARELRYLWRNAVIKDNLPRLIGTRC